MNEKSIKLCIISLGAYPLLAGKSTKNIIGPDVHQAILAKEFFRQGFKVSVVCYGDKYPLTEYIDGIEIIKIKENNCRPRAINITLKVLQIWNAMRKSNAHIYFHAGGVIGISSIFCKLAGSIYVYGIASDALVNRKIITKRIREFNQSKLSLRALGNWLDIMLADAVIVQSTYQMKMLKKNYGKESVLIKMPFPLRGNPEKVKPPIALWVGSMAEVKQPEIFLELAARIPEGRFQMIGGYSGSPKLYDRIRDESKKISNLEFFGVVPFNEIDDYFSQASILINTSMFEGFPNAFIQAWMHYLPVISLNADPDEVICRKNLGFHSKTVEKMVEDLKILLDNQKLREEMGKNARKHAEKEHNAELIIKNI